MKDYSTRSKVVVRHLPPALSQSAFMEHIETRFSGLSNWITFYPGKSSNKASIYSRAYIDFKHPDDVFEFHQQFNGHIFVNEKGTQYKAMVEYAPNQRVPKLWHKKDAREGAILQDPEYIKFVEMLSKPIEYLPSAEVQLERKEAERNLNLASGSKDSVVVTPLMEFVRQKRAMKSMPQKLVAGSGKTSARGSSPTSSAKVIAKRGSRTSAYSPGSRPKEKSTYVPRSDDRKARVVIEIKEKKVSQDISRKAGSTNLNSPAVENGVEQSNSQLLMAGKKDTISANQVDGAPVTRILRSLKSQVQSLASSQSVISDDPTILSPKPSHRVDIVGRTNKGSSSSKNPVLLQKMDQQSEKDKRISRSQGWRSSAKESNNTTENESQQHHGTATYMEDRADTSGRRLRNKDRPDRPVWTVRRRGDVSSSADSPISFNGTPSLSPPGSQRQGKGIKECDNNAVSDATRPTNKRVGGTSTLYGGHEKQVWVAKPGSGS